MLPHSSRRHLIHRDFNLANILSEDGVITGVVDWQGMGYGDPMYDAAWTDFWSPELDFATKYAKVIGEKDWKSRLRCYQLLMNARSLAFFINTGQEHRMGDLPTKARNLLA